MFINITISSIINIIIIDNIIINIKFINSGNNNISNYN